MSSTDTIILPLDGMREESKKVPMNLGVSLLIYLEVNSDGRAHFC